MIKVKMAYADIFNNAMIVFSEGCYWEIPTTEGNALEMARIANNVAGVEIDSIEVRGDEEIVFRGDFDDQQKPQTQQIPPPLRHHNQQPPPPKLG